MILNHFDDQVIEDANVADVFLSVLLWSEDVGAESDGQVVCSHFVLRLTHRYLIEKLNVVLERIEI